MNGGVQLLRLRAMRQGTFTQLLWRYARSDLPLDGSTGLGVIGDQTLYSWMSINNTPAQKHIARLPCSWNVQVGAWPSTVGHGERRWGKACASGCKLLHGNGAWGKLLLHPILNDPSGRSCRRIFERWLGTSHYRKGSMSEKLLNRTGRECCPTLPAEASSSAGSGSGSMAGSRLRHGLRSRVAGGVVAGSASAAGRDEAADALWREAQRRYPGARQPG